MRFAVLTALGSALLAQGARAQAEEAVCDEGSVLQEVAAISWYEPALELEPDAAVFVCIDANDPRCSPSSPTPTHTLDHGVTERVLVRDSATVGPARAVSVRWDTEERAPRDRDLGTLDRPPR